MKCGYVRAEDWQQAQASWGYIDGAPPMRPVTDGTRIEDVLPRTCPGYTTCLPQVGEVADAWGWWERGQLGMRGDLPEAVAELVSLFNQEINSAREWYLEQTKPR